MLSSALVGFTAISVARLPAMSLINFAPRRPTSSHAGEMDKPKSKRKMQSNMAGGSEKNQSPRREIRGDQQQDSKDFWNREKVSNQMKSRLLPARDYMDERTSTEGSSREIVCAEAVAWMKGFEVLPGSVFTSLPDLIELEMEGREAEYRAWFLEALDVIFARLGEGRYAIFYQTDVKVPVWAEGDPKRKRVLKTDGPGRMTSELLDKSALCIQAGERRGCKLMWRKVVSKGAPEALSVSRPSFTHLLCLARPPAAFDATKFNTPELLPRGLMVWPKSSGKAIGVNAAMLGVRFLKEVVGETSVVDPFCGLGTIPAAANVVGMSSVGVDLSPLKCEKARRLRVEAALADEGHAEEAYRGHMPKLRLRS